MSIVRRALALAMAGALLVPLGGTIQASAGTVDPATHVAIPGPSIMSADALPTAQIDGIVWSQAIVGDTVYAGGKFATARPGGVAVGGAGQVVRGNLVAYNIKTGQLTD